eukprot:2090710-Prymnesium_polylepis.1
MGCNGEVVALPEERSRPHPPHSCRDPRCGPGRREIGRERERRQDVLTTRTAAATHLARGEARDFMGGDSRRGSSPGQGGR